MSQSGDYIFKLKVYPSLELANNVFAERLFKVKLIDPCVTAELSIDDSVFKTLPAVSLTQYVTYDA